MDNMIEFLVGMRGLVAHQTYASYRAELHALGETNMFPDVMYQSFIDQFSHMESRLTDVPVMIYIDISPEEAYANIQKDPDMSEDEKAFYTLDYLRAYQQGYEDLVLAPLEQRQNTLVICLTPQDLENVPATCEKLLQVYPDMYNLAGHWDHRYLAPDMIRGRQQPAHGESYFKFVDDNMDIIDQARQGRNARGRHKIVGINHWSKNNIWSQKLIEWRYPLDVVDKGHYWFNDKEKNWIPNIQSLNTGDMRYHESKFLNKRGYGYRVGMNIDDHKGSNLVMDTLCHDVTPRYSNPVSGRLMRPWQLVAQ